MKCTILHEGRGRMRVHVCNVRMTLHRADVLEAYLNHDAIEKATVYERTGDVVLYYRGKRADAVKALSVYKFDQPELDALVTTADSRKINQEYQSKMYNLVAGHYFRKFFLPAPIRAAYTVWRSIAFVWKGVKCLLHRKLEVEVLDALSIGVSAGHVVMEAVRQIEAGMGLADLEHTLALAARNTRVFFAVKELGYLRAGGRISEAAYRLGSVLNVKPVFTCDEEGRYAVTKKARGWERALDAEIGLIAKLAEKYPKCRLAVSCTSACADLYDRMERALREKVSNAVEVVKSDISPALLVHTGPNLVGVAIQGL